MTELSKSYKPKIADEKWGDFWEKNHFYAADPNSDKPPFCLVMPPPNVTGILHMGHALVTTLQDILVRYKRMQGFDVLWIPGTDHAGISTQTVVERHLIAKTGKGRRDIGREAFLKEIWKWKELNEKEIINQLKKLGASCDWSRIRFTMDAQSNRAVKAMFKKMFDAGLIYQGDYLVNWDPITQTALADDEVEYEEHDSALWYFRYPIQDSDAHILIATSRPETMLGDTAVAVSPKDERYKHLVGKTIILPLVNRPIPILADNYVDATFGSGAVKITPAHDPNDYEIAMRHDLPMINIMTPDGKINENGGEFAGLPMEEARKAVGQRLKELGLVEKIEPYRHRVGVSYRSKAVIEPYLSKQWFVKMSVFKEKLIDAVKSDRVTLIPENWKSTYFHWIENLRDWCISRQLWWGHRIPIWHHKHDPERKICYDGEGLPPEVAKNPEDWEQDLDVLDTWFSSSLWPFSTLGWPDHTHELSRYYPNATLITGHDILFFWVARMILMGEYGLEQVPFERTFLHGLIYGKSYWRKEISGHIAYVPAQEKVAYDLGKKPPADVDSKWEKMSKSKGNVIDPLEMIDTYGTDAVRIALAASATHARQIDLDRRRFEEFKNFANKLWNGSRFVFMNLEGLAKENAPPLSSKSLSNGLREDLLTLEDRWILSLQNQIAAKIKLHLDAYEFDHAAMAAYEFFWDDFCAYYVEMAKPILFGKEGDVALRQNKQILLLIVLTSSLRLLHPFTPFITEELFYKIKIKFSKITLLEKADPYTREMISSLLSPACMVSPYPDVIRQSDINPAIEQQFSFLREVVYALRNIRAEMQIPPNLRTNLFIEFDSSSKEGSILSENTPALRALIPLDHIECNPKNIPDQMCSTAFVSSLKLIIPMPAELKEKEKQRLDKEREKLKNHLVSLEGQLQNKNFVERAPEQLVSKTKEQQMQTQAKLAEIDHKLSALSAK